MKTGKYAAVTLIAYTGFIAAWAAMTLPAGLIDGGMRLAFELIFVFLGLGTVGVLVPVIIAHRMQAPFNETSTRNGIIAGILFYVLAAGIEVIIFQSWFKILTVNPDDLVRMKYTFISLPLAIAVSVFSFVLAPGFLHRPGNASLKPAVAQILLPAASLGLLMFLLTGFEDMRIPAVMALVGALAGAGHALTKKFFLSFLTVFFAMHANTLSGELYRGLGWPVAAAGLIFSVAALFIGWMEDKEAPEGIQSC